MAVGRFILANTGVKHIVAGNINLNTDTIVAYPLHRGYTPNTASHSTLAQIVAAQATASGNLVAAITLAGQVFTGSGAAQNKFDANDLSGFSAGGDTFACKYVALIAQSASAAGADNLLIGWFDTDTAATTGVEGTQLNVTWAAGGIFEFNSNP